MIEKFKIHISNNFPFLKGKKLLLATSGGLDSMVMVHLFKALDYNFALVKKNKHHIIPQLAPSLFVQFVTNHF